MILWSVGAFLLIGAEELLPYNELVANIGVCGYFVVFGVLIFLRALKFVKAREHGVAVAVGAASSLVTLYSLSLEFTRVLQYFGLADLWLSKAYSSWWFWIMFVRATLIFGSLVILIVKAGTEVSGSPGQHSILSRNLWDHVARQFAAWADFMFAFAEEFWELFVRSLNVVTRLAIRFVLEEVFPAFVILGAAITALEASIQLSSYARGQRSSTLVLGAALFVTIFAGFGFGYLKLVADSGGDSLDWPPLRRAINPYWYGAITDTRMFVAHASYVIPLTSLLLYGFSRVALHFGYQLSIPGFGFYSLASTIVFVGFLGWGYMRNRASRKALSPFGHDKLYPR